MGTQGAAIVYELCIRLSTIVKIDFSMILHPYKTLGYYCPLYLIYSFLKVCLIILIKKNVF